MEAFIPSTKIINVGKVCRICLAQKKCLREIFETRIPKMLESCAALQMHENDSLPSRICSGCFHLTTKFYTFKKKAQQNDRILRQYIKNENKSKIKKSNIINIAFNGADGDDVNTCPETHTEEFDDTIDSNSDDMSDEDIPLIQRIKTISERGKTSSVEKLQARPALENKTIIFPDDLPPLVPLEPLYRITPPENIVKDLPIDTPPLVPINPLVKIEVLENLVSNDETIKYQCNICDKELISVAELREHKRTTCQSNALQCNICKKQFKESKRLIGHLKGHVIGKHYGCKVCGKTYPNPSTFAVHMRSHTGERPFKCEVCHKGFMRWAGVIGHMKTHEEVKPFVCNTCGKAFKILSNLERHKVLHTGVLPYRCNYCGKGFSQSENLQSHTRTYHTSERPFLCNECGKVFVSATRLNRHMWSHTGYKPYSCRMCSKAYINSCDLKNHERIHHLGKNSEFFKNYVCNVCNMRFYHPCRLARHKKVHDKVINCNMCHKSFNSNYHLSRHMDSKHALSIVEVIPDIDEVHKIFGKYADDILTKPKIDEYSGFKDLIIYD